MTRRTGAAAARRAGALAALICALALPAPARADPEVESARLLSKACEGIQRHAYESAAASAASSAVIGGVHSADDLLLRAVALEGQALHAAVTSGGAGPWWKGQLQEAIELLGRQRSRPSWPLPADSDPVVVQRRIVGELARYSAAGGLRGVTAEDVRPPHPDGVCRFYPPPATGVGRPPPSAYPVDRCPLYQSMAQQAEGWSSTGRCEDVRILAAGLTERCPELPLGYRLQGEASACAGDDFASVAPFRKFLALGGSDDALSRLVDKLEADMGTVMVRLKTAPAAGPAEVRLIAEGQKILPAVGSSPRGLLFRDIPPHKKLRVTVQGRGFVPTELEVPALQPGDDVAVDLEVRYLGLGGVRIVKFPPGDLAGATWEVFADGRQVRLRPGEETVVTAGVAQLVVTNDLGRRAVDLDVQPDRTVTVDPRDWVPTMLNLAGVPAGARLQVIVEGEGDAEASVELPQVAGDGRLDPVTGVEVVDSLLVGPLVGGKAGIALSHPSLGTALATKFLKSGDVTFYAFPLQAFSNHAAVRDGWLEYSAGIGRRRRGHTAGVIAGIAGAVGGAIASGLMVWQGAVHGAEALDIQARARLALPDQQAAALAAFNDQAAASTTFFVSGAVSGGVAAVVTGLTVGFSATAKRRLRWRPPTAP